MSDPRFHEETLRAAFAKCKPLPERKMIERKSFLVFFCAEEHRRKEEKIRMNRIMTKSI